MLSPAEFERQQILTAKGDEKTRGYLIRLSHQSANESLRGSGIPAPSKVSASIL